MVDPDYLRRQAVTCMKWSAECFDLATASRLRQLAEAFVAKAIEIETAANLQSRMKAHDEAPSSPAPDPLQTRGDAP